MSATIRQAERRDIEDAVQVDQACWPPGLSFTAERLASVLKTFPEGSFVADSAGSVVGLITSLRINSETVLGPLPSWHDVTDNGCIAGTHVPDGPCLFVMAVSVLPFYRDHSLGRRLVNAELDLARRLPGVRNVMGYTRIPRYKRRSDLSVEDYLKLYRPDGRHFDSVLSFHLSNGAQIVGPVKDARPQDKDSLGYGVLINYDARLRGDE